MSRSIAYDVTVTNSAFSRFPTWLSIDRFFPLLRIFAGVDAALEEACRTVESSRTEAAPRLLAYSQEASRRWLRTTMLWDALGSGRCQ